jgi:hypothetical protein
MVQNGPSRITKFISLPHPRRPQRIDLLQICLPAVSSIILASNNDYKTILNHLEKQQVAASCRTVLSG